MRGRGWKCDARLADKIFVLSLVVATLQCLSLEDSAAVVEEGRRHYAELTVEAELPRFGECWKRALIDLRDGCKRLDEDVQTRLALSFAHCFLLKTGVKSAECGATEQIKACVSRFDERGFATLSQFFTHTHAMCCFLQTQVWNERTGRLIHSLTHTSHNVSRELRKSHRLQKEMAKEQRRAMEMQNRLWNKGNELSRVLHDSEQNVKRVMDEFKSNTNEQRMLISEIFSRVASLQTVLLGEFAGFYSLVFYAVAACLVYLLSSTRRTAESRFWLFLLLTANIVAERFVVQNGKIEADGFADVIYERIWTCRKISSLMAAFVLVAVIYRYRDYNLINNRLLVEIKQQNLELKKYIQSRISTEIDSSVDPTGILVSNQELQQSTSDAMLRTTGESSDVATVQDSPRVTPRRKKTSSTPRSSSSLTIERSPHSYNLRQRNRGQVRNPLIERETEQEFTNFIHALAANSKSTSKRVRRLFATDHASTTDFD